MPRLPQTKAVPVLSGVQWLPAWIPLLALAAGAGLAAQVPSTGDERAAAARAFLDALEEDQRDAASFPFESKERLVWNFEPDVIRKGVMFGDLDSTQIRALFAMMRTMLSPSGFEKYLGIQKVAAYRSLSESEISPDFHWIAVFGDPGTDSLWGWRVEGYHHSVHYTSIGGQVFSAAPAFRGALPRIIPSGPDSGLEVLEDEYRMGLDLVNSLDPAQLDLALVRTTAPEELLTGTGPVAKRLDPDGIPFGDLDSAQQDLLLALIRVFLDNNQPDMADALWERVEGAGRENIRFVWMGGTKEGEVCYYRIHTPNIIIEMDDRWDGEHIHTVLREVDNDFAVDMLTRHYTTDTRHRRRLEELSGRGPANPAVFPPLGARPGSASITDLSGRLLLAFDRPVSVDGLRRLLPRGLALLRWRDADGDLQSRLLPGGL